MAEKELDNLAYQEDILDSDVYLSEQREIMASKYRKAMSEWQRSKGTGADKDELKEFMRIWLKVLNKLPLHDEVRKEEQREIMKVFREYRESLGV